MTAVIPTLGRPSVGRAIQSVLDQTRPISEIIVVVDADTAPMVPLDDRITLLNTPFRAGPSRCRQLGIDAARGDVIALLDDDDEWCDTKLERQLNVVGAQVDSKWIASSRFSVVGPGSRRRIWPRRLIGQRQSVAEYLFRFTDVRVGGADLQSSTLCFPTELARTVRWDAEADAVNDEATWLISIQRAVPDLRVVHVPEVLSTYNVGGVSVSRSPSDRTVQYINWGIAHLGTASPRILGDYLCTYPVSAAVSARSLRGVRIAMRSAFTLGSPGPFAIGYASVNYARVALQSAEPATRR